MLGKTAGSESKLRTYHDGFRILRLITSLLQYERPLAFFPAIGAFFAAVSVALGIPLLLTYLHTDKVPRLPTAVLSTGLALIAILSLVVGLILNGVLRQRQEAARLAYLTYPPVLPPVHTALELPTLDRVHR